VLCAKVRWWDVEHSLESTAAEKQALGQLAMPLEKTESLAAGIAAVAALDKYALDELKSLAKPPEAVKDCVTAVAIILGRPNKDWAEIVKKTLADKKLLQALQDVDGIAEIKPKQLKKLKKIVEAEGFTKEEMEKKSKAVAALAQWVIGVYDGAAPAVTSAENDLKESHPKEWELFSALDADDSGALDKDELWVKLSSMGEEQATQLIDMVDMNGVRATSAYRTQLSSRQPLIHTSSGWCWKRGVRRGYREIDHCPCLTGCC
jgi:hypothetical protein